MALPTINAFSLQNSTYITKSIHFRTMAARNIETADIARRMGSTLLNTQVGYKIIRLSGIVLADTADALRRAVDELQKELNVVDGELIIEDDRAYRVTRRTVNMPDLNYSMTTVPFEVEFICPDGYARGSQHLAGFDILGGVNTLTFGVTVSGSVENRPIVNFTLPSGIGPSNIVKIDLSNSATGNQVTVSGVFDYGSNVTFNYDRFEVIVDGEAVDYVGVFDPINPGNNSFQVTVSGTHSGISGRINYSPRYW
jgi:predicted phage tail component-like protein